MEVSPVFSRIHFGSIQLQFHTNKKHRTIEHLLK